MSNHGTHLYDFQSCLICFNAINIRPFLNPVSREEVPDYYDIIKDPVDLRLLGTRIKDRFI